MNHNSGITSLCAQTILPGVIGALTFFLAAGNVAAANWTETVSGGSLDQTWTFAGIDNSTPTSMVVPIPNADTALDLSNSDLRLLATGANLPGVFDIAVVGFVAGDTFTNVRVEASVDGLPTIDLTGSAIDSTNGLFVRARANAATNDGYSLAVDYLTGDLVIGKTALGVTAPLVTASAITGFSITDKYLLQLDMIGSDLTGRVFDSTGTSLLAMTSAVDTDFASGVSGISAVIDLTVVPPPSTLPLLGARFDDISSTAIPEPATGVLLGLGLVVLLSFHRRRRG